MESIFSLECMHKNQHELTKPEAIITLFERYLAQHCKMIVSNVQINANIEIGIEKKKWLRIKEKKKERLIVVFFFTSLTVCLVCFY